MTINSLNEQLKKACESQSWGKANRLVKKGADPNTIVDDEGRSALNSAAWHCAFKTVKAMLKAGADHQNRDKEWGNTPFLSACTSGCKKTVEILLEAGSDINERSKDGATGLMYAVHNEQKHLIPFLKEKGIDINGQNEKGQTALMYILSKEDEFFSFDREKERKLRMEIMDELIKHGTDINLYDSFGNTALTHAVYRGSLEYVKFILDKGADINAPKKSILMTVDEIPNMKDAEKQEITKLLISRGAKAKPFFSRYKINVNCKECGTLIPLNEPVENLKCDSCFTVNKLDNEFWNDILKETYSEWSSQDSFKVEYEVCIPRCLECDTELDVNGINNSTSKIVCSKCNHENNVYPAPDWFKKFEKYQLSPNKIISGISLAGSNKEEKEIKPIAIRCISCGAALKITVDTPRNCTCDHCTTVQYLPNPVWKALHPVKKRENWYIYYSN